MKKILTGTLPLIFFHLFCCGVLLYLLISSGILLLLANESRNKFFLIPLLFLAAFSLWLYRRQNNKFTKFLLYAVFSLTFGFLFTIYIFIPWWIPGYTGGILLP
ncbi:hypothetical protein A3D78_03905 [Candidatus Gottesmanbacteria bacterium RIFCSPHIGHO2_02_FULL_39_14]|uniref:Uncharacterized protein n=1 Tax=Candidatus Gottesmanbacteria bacterium RIFCSPHIGHO2_02_FULL_39_14 TaxID=1798383 RepID=A0A1F5ZYG6_9BACT|nr:MAG: hypothetical protein A3D78_03905 [Candidatus Gottesmanbacteria bacterium RIFCSPHIGHO2_02_FULL_39_14]